MAGRSMNRKGIALALRWILGAIFLYSGGAKLVDPAAFQTNIANFELVSSGFAGLVAVYLPWLEMLCGAALILRWKMDGALALLGLLLMVFIFFVGSAWARGLDVTCGCFGATDAAPNYPLWIVRNLAMLGGLGGIRWLDLDGRRSGGSV